VTIGRAAAWIALAAVALGFSWYVSSRPMDFRVYHYGARGVFDGTRPVYGTASGLGWPMHYRYPPFFLLLFAPFARLPLGLAAALWLLLKVAVLVLLVRALCRRLPSAAGAAGWLVPILLAGPFVIQDLRYGNAQFFIFACTAFALLRADAFPFRAGLLLGLAIAVKLWPLFFIPYLFASAAARRRARAPRLRTAGWSLIVAGALTLLPSLYFGVRSNAALMAQWFQQESSTQTGEEEIWFPSQSLRGVMMRYLTQIDYSRVPDANYPPVNIAHMDPHRVRLLWFAAVAGAYACFLALVYSRKPSLPLTWEALGFCLVGLLQPFTQKYALVILLLPAMVAGRIREPRISRLLLYGSMAAVLIQPLIAGASGQRLIQALGLDFVATVLLASALTLLPKRPARRKGRSILPDAAMVGDDHDSTIELT
jgi:hypothetical protein